MGKTMPITSRCKKCRWIDFRYRSTYRW